MCYEIHLISALQVHKTPNTHFSCIGNVNAIQDVMAVNNQGTIRVSQMMTY